MSDPTCAHPGLALRNLIARPATGNVLLAEIASDDDLLGGLDLVAVPPSDVPSTHVEHDPSSVQFPCIKHISVVLDPASHLSRRSPRCRPENRGDLNVACDIHVARYDF